MKSIESDSCIWKIIGSTEIIGEKLDNYYFCFMEELLRICVPSELLDYFDFLYLGEFVTLNTKESGILIHLEEKNILPLGYEPLEFESKGFMNASIVQDFPLRGKAIYYSIRKRRWRHKTESNKIISRDFSFLADKTRMTADLADFLKDRGREPSRYDVEYL